MCEHVTLFMMFGHHIRLRWWQRGGRNRPRIEIAWQEAKPVDVVGKRYDRARYHEPTETVILWRRFDDGTVVESEHQTMYRSSEKKCHQCHTPVDDGQLCDTCGADVIGQRQVTGVERIS